MKSETTESADIFVNKINDFAKKNLINDKKYSLEEAKSILCKLNGLINNHDKPSQLEEFTATGILPAGNAYIVTPYKATRAQIASNYLKAFNECRNKSIKCKIAFHAIAILHLFEDGNGRTARIVYKLLKDGKLSTDHIGDYMHGRERRNFLHFQDENKTGDTITINKTALQNLVNQEVENGILPSDFKDAAIYFYGRPTLDDLKKVGFNSEEAFFYRNSFFRDGHFSGLALAIDLYKNHPELAKNVFEKGHQKATSIKNYERYVLTAEISRNPEQYQLIWNNLTKEDWQRIAGIYHQLKIEHSLQIINIITAE